MSKTIAGLSTVRVDDIGNDYLRVLIHGPQGSGKAQRYGTPVLTPDGWVPIEKLTEGDYVIGSSGQPVRVFGVWDRGVMPVYKITMNDGATTNAAGDHLWRIKNRKGRWQVLTTDELREDWDRSYAKSNPAIPRMKAAEHPERALPLPPYMLGGLLADGSLHARSVSWTKNRNETVAEMRRSAGSDEFSVIEMTSETSTARRWRFAHADDTAHNSIVIRRLEQLGLRVRSAEKFIPDDYLVASIEQRQDLLAGLFDGDGRLSGKGQPLYHTTSLRLAKDVQRLCWSLGIGANMRRKKSDGTWCVGIVSTEVNPFRAAEHAEKVNDREAYYVEDRRIVAIESDGQDEVRCIAVEAADRLYVTEDYIVTHNTTLASTVAEMGKTLFIDLVGEKGTRSFAGAPHAKNIDIVRPDSVQILDDVFWDLNKGGHDYSAVVIDSVTSVQKMALRFLLGHDETAVREIRQGTAPADMRTWGQSLDIMVDLATFWYGLADADREKPMHVVMTAQSKMTETDDGTRRFVPDVQKGALSILRATPDYILYTDVEENMDAIADDSLPPVNHIIRFGANPDYSTKARVPFHLRGKFPPVMGRKSPVTLGRLARLLEAGGTSAPAE